MNQKVQKEKFSLQKLFKNIQTGDGKFFKKLQFLGQAMLFPLLSVPVAAVFYRFGILMTDTTNLGVKEYSVVWYIGTILTKFGQPIFTNLPIIFGIGLAFGLTKERRGEAAIAGAMGAWTLMSLLGENSFASLFYDKVLPFANLDPDGKEWVLAGHSQLLYMPKAIYEGTILTEWKAVYNLEVGVLGGIFAGWFTAMCYNKWKNIHMPNALSMFEGMRFIPLVSVFMMVPLALVTAVIWPWIQFGLMKLSTELSVVGQGNNPGVAYAITAFLKFFTDLLCLTGLENVVNTFLSYQLPITGFLPDGTKMTIYGDVPAFNAGLSGAGLFQTGGYMAVLGGYWGIALAVIVCARKEIRKQVGQMVLPIALFCSLTGMGQTLMFPLWYASPLLWVVTSIGDGLFGGIPVAMGIRTGCAFASGYVDWILSAPLSWTMSLRTPQPWVTNPLWMLACAGLTAICFFPVFTFLIHKNNLQTSFILNVEEQNREAAAKEGKKIEEVKEKNKSFS